MKKLLYIVFTALFLVLVVCDQNSELDIGFIEQPSGGKNITLLSCIFEGKLLESTTPITVSIEWWSTDSAGANEQLEQQDSYTFESGIAEQVGTELSAVSGDVLEGSYWVRLEWSDGTGSVYYEESDQAFCYKGPNNL